MPTRRFCFPILFLLLTAAVLFSLAPIRVLQVRAADNSARLLCSAISPGDELLLFSVNSIFNAPVQDRLRVAEDGALETVDVVSTPAVMNYFAIEKFTIVEERNPPEQTLVRGVPRPVRYPEVRLMVGPRGQQRMMVHKMEIALYQLVPEGTSLIVSVENAPRIAACWLA